MMLKRLIFLLLFTAAGAYGQNFRYENLLINQNGAPVVGANVWVCAGQVTPNFSNNPPCTLATIYSDLAGTQQISQSIVSSVGTSTQTGSFAFVVATGTYTLAINGAGLQASDLITVPNVTGTTMATNLAGPGTISGTFGGNYTTTGNNTHSGTETFTGRVYTCQQGNVLYVGGPITCWAGADIGAQINSAYAALPSTGGEIDILPQASGACYNYTTPIVMTTASKFATVRGLAPNSINDSFIITGVCLNYTPTTATSA